mmetsp:Transcript_2136/g.3506  ORF Transcript_2136/g.3506 Transcript_2136/m.3506 type:complete len:334 (-) Transcript_2136:62-1063(-)
MMKPTDNLSRDTEAVADSLSAMIKRECTSYSCYDGYLNPSDPTMITADDRKQLVDWCYGLVDHCKFSRETVASAMEMVDRFLSIPSNSTDAAQVCDEALRDPSQFQLLTIAALYSSIKVHEQVALSSELFSEICSRIYTAEEIEAMELTLLSGLSWRCHAPTAHQVGLSILSLLLPYVDIPEVTWGFLMDEIKYLTELAVQDYYFSTQRASTTALAAILNVISDSSTKERREVLGVYLDLGVITECFDFEGSEQITAARRRLHFLTRPDTGGDEIMDDERSLEESVMTLKVSNSSSHGKRYLEDLSHDHGHVVSPNSSLIDLSCDEQDSVHFC